MEKCIKAIRSKHSLSDSRTEFIIIGTRQQSAKVSIDCLSVGDISITPAVGAFKDLKSRFDENMGMVTHK